MGNVSDLHFGSKAKRKKKKKKERLTPENVFYAKKNAVAMTTTKSLEKPWVPATKGFHSPFCFDHCCVDKKKRVKRFIIPCIII